MNCNECIHAEMCKWIDQLGGRGCDFYDDNPCEDAISRADAIEALTGWETEPTDEEIEYTLKKLPSVTQKSGKWIPVSERLPKDSGEFLVSVIDDLAFRCDRNYETVKVARFAHKKDYSIKESEWRELRTYETVTAWMPLPEPYKAEMESGK